MALSKRGTLCIPGTVVRKKHRRKMNKESLQINADYSFQAPREIDCSSPAERKAKSWRLEVPTSGNWHNAKTRRPPPPRGDLGILPADHFSMVVSDTCKHSDNIPPAVQLDGRLVYVSKLNLILIIIPHACSSKTTEDRIYNVSYRYLLT